MHANPWLIFKNSRVTGKAWYLQNANTEDGLHRKEILKFCVSSHKPVVENVFKYLHCHTFWNWAKSYFSLHVWWRFEQKLENYNLFSSWLLSITHKVNTAQSGHTQTPTCCALNKCTGSVLLLVTVHTLKCIFFLCELQQHDLHVQYCLFWCNTLITPSACLCVWQRNYFTPFVSLLLFLTA